MIQNLELLGKKPLDSDAKEPKASTKQHEDINIDSVTTRDELVALWPEDILGDNPFPKNL
jgi:hypothetical protein